MLYIRAGLFVWGVPISKRKSGGKMTEKIESCEMKRVEDYLKGYIMNARLLRLEEYEKEYFKENTSVVFESLGEIPLARARMYEIRHFINSLKNCDEKLFLYYHYIKGEKVERCSELFGISRSSAFRMKNRALTMAVMAFRKKERGVSD